MIFEAVNPQDVSRRERYPGTKVAGDFVFCWHWWWDGSSGWLFRDKRAASVCFGNGRSRAWLIHLPSSAFLTQTAAARIQTPIALVPLSQTAQLMLPVVNLCCTRPVLVQLALQPWLRCSYCDSALHLLLVLHGAKYGFAYLNTALISPRKTNPCRSIVTLPEVVDIFVSDKHLAELAFQQDRTGRKVFGWYHFTSSISIWLVRLHMFVEIWLLLGGERTLVFGATFEKRQVSKTTQYRYIISHIFF